ncbi:hypothetical protein [uncultured Odoribacter sp.]|uniref:hypothetical protein n=1 Tax=uncultured Odoribacter sp. TaxID=876416 RepID=UPI002604462B|nr:hypothetical protein [uncultured Odoribacter sp.]
MTDSLKDILSDLQDIVEDNNKLDNEIESLNCKINHRIDVCEHTQDILDNATKEFNSLTSIINKKDIPFFVFSVLLQCAMKYYIKTLREMSDKELAKKTPFHRDEKSDRLGNAYYASKEEIISNPVPFDAIQKEHDNNWYKLNKAERPGFTGFNHRVIALGHDPLLGLIFGTANIMTATITRYDFASWHINTMAHLRKARNGEEYFAQLDTICERAKTIDIFRSIGTRLKEEGEEGWITLGYALFKEIVHLMSDLPSKQSLPIPIISTFSPKLARELSLYGLNTGTVVQGGIATMVINWTIGFLHGITRSKDENENLFKVRTCKIIMYSNILATVSDIGYSIFTAYMGDKNTMRKFDLGGYLVTLYQISHSSNVISAIEQEFYTKKIIEQLNK